MGLLRLPALEDHWCTNKYHGSRVNTIISSINFKIISHILHLSDNSKLVKIKLTKMGKVLDFDSQNGYYDKQLLYKIQPLFRFMQSWEKLYNPKKELTLDETISHSMEDQNFLFIIHKYQTSGDSKVSLSK